MIMMIIMSVSTARTVIKEYVKAYLKVHNAAKLWNVIQVTTVQAEYVQNYWEVAKYVCETMTVVTTITVVEIQNAPSMPQSPMVKLAQKTNTAKVSSAVHRITNATMLLKALEASP